MTTIQAFADRLAAEHKKHDEKLAKLEEKNGKSPYNLTLNPLEYDRYLKWQKKHRKTCNLRPTKDNPFPLGAAGGSQSLEFTFTGIGIAVTAKCSCGKEENVTDYDVW